jgi:hypothetical protein
MTAPFEFRRLLESLFSATGGEGRLARSVRLRKADNHGRPSRLPRAPTIQHTPELTAASDDDAAPVYEERPLVPLARIPWLAVTAEGLRFLPLDAEAAYLLSLVDGRTTFEAILDICDMGRHVALLVLMHLLRVGAIELSERISET